MKFKDIPARILSIRVKPTAKTLALQEQPAFSVCARLSHEDEFEVRLRDSIIFVRPVVSADIRLLNAELASGGALLAQLANPAADGSVELQIAFFTGDCVEMGDIEIGVDEYVENRLPKMLPGLKGQNPYRKLDQLCCFHQDEDVFFFLTAGSAIDKQLKPDFESAPTESSAKPIRTNSFGITGDGIRFVATVNDHSVLIVTRLTKQRGDPDRALRLAKGELRFVGWTQAGQLQILAKAQMTKLTQDDGSYLRKWDEFGDLEGELLLKQARAVGALQFMDMTERRDGTVSVRVVEASDSALTALAKGQVPEVEFVDEVPKYLLDENVSFRDFANVIEGSVAENGSLGRKREQRKAKIYFKVFSFDKETRSLALKTENLPTPSGTLVLSLAGEIAQIKRRISARQAILEGRSANPQLGLLIEERGQITRVREPQKISPLTAFVRKKVFRNDPTVMQEKAIEVALNTPDIALIQGPPGTGKTTVIAAILERLNEMADKRGASVKGQVLLTGFQHDAVENMIERLSLNSIPVPKFGQRSGAAKDADYNAFERNLEDWCTKLATELREQNPQIAEVEQEREIKNLFLQYIQAPTRPFAASLVRKIAALGVVMLGESDARRAENLAKNLTREEKLNDNSSQWLNATRRMRVQLESFSDDGPERLVDTLEDLRDVLEESERKLLDKASLWRSEDGSPSFLADLVALKMRLLIRFSSPPVFRVEKQNDEVVALAEFAIQRIKTVGHSAKDRKSAALAEFLAELESNPYGIRDAVSDYSFAFAATCQQSVNSMMQARKGITGRDTNENQKGMEYEYVIVDEAARVSPRDLMVAMVQGKRIILVGDHRQLPHIIDEEVARQMEEGEAGQEENDWLKKSMFQYLFSSRLKTLEEGDRITRRVTLDKQYRMHPLLGSFVSRNFYERFDPTEKFGSGRPVSDFAHALSGTNGKPAVWLDVPVQKGQHQKVGTSWTRSAEAVLIATKLQDWIYSAAGLCGYLTFSEEDDFFNFPSFLIKLKSRSRPFDKWIFKQLPFELQNQLLNNPSEDSYKKLILENLEKIISKELIFEENRFKDIKIRKEVRKLLLPQHPSENIAHLNRLLIEDAYPLEVKKRPLSFGVISFYKAQADFIKRQLGNITDDEKRLRIGTVDSFQGMEFDVVFLSVVRTLPQNWRPKDDDRERQARGLFGHLCLYNRLNVSMSRQKKLLVVVGDVGSLQNQLAMDFVPGLVDFLKLCREQGVVLSC